jgi:hypothetical protein
MEIMMTKSTPQKLKYQKEYNAKPEEVAKRVKNNAARREAIKRGTAKVGDGKDVAHIKALANGGTNAKGNTKVESRATNRGWRAGSGSYNPDK